MKKFLLRAVLGCLLIFCVNQVLSYQGISVSVGLNIVSLLTSGTLGLPGVFLLYGIMALQVL